MTAKPLLAGGQKLDRWLRTQKHTKTWLAEKLGVRRQVVSRWIFGSRPPSTRYANEIEKITGVAPREWLRATKERSR